jgi:PHD/YefM family antitoxin component YafN of YafNO toxin-antitoxin module
MNAEPRVVTATNFQRNIGAHMDNAHAGETIIVANHRRVRLVLMGVKEWEELVEAKRYLGVLREEAARRKKAMSEGQGSKDGD